MAKMNMPSRVIVQQHGNILKLQTRDDSVPYVVLGLLSWFTALAVLFGTASRLWLVLFLGLVGLLLLGYALHLYYTTWTFDRVRGRVIHKMPGVPAHFYPLDVLEAVLLDSRRRGRDTVYRVVLKFAGRAWVPLSGYGAYDAQLEAQLAICDFVGLEEPQTGLIHTR